MKYQLIKIFPLVKKKKKNAGKPHFGTDLGLLGPNMDHNVFWGFSSTGC